MTSGETLFNDELLLKTYFPIKISNENLLIETFFCILKTLRFQKSFFYGTNRDPDDPVFFLHGTGRVRVNIFRGSIRAPAEPYVISSLVMTIPRTDLRIINTHF